MGKLAALGLLIGFAAIQATPRPARAGAELDRKYALDSIGALRSWDNVDGLFGDYVSQAYKEALSRQTRFRVVELAKADAIFAAAASRVPYAKAIDDAEILTQLSRSLKVESLIRTRVFKEGPRYRFTVDWLHFPQMEILGSDTFFLEDQGAAKNGASDGSQAKDFAGLGDIKGNLQQSLDRVFAKVPFVGNVTGRDNAEVTVNLGFATRLRRGDTLVVGTLEEVKRHPLLKQIVEWRTIPVGKVEIDTVDEALAFGHVTEQEEGRDIHRNQKVLRVIPRPEPPARPTSIDSPVDLVEEPPRLGFAVAALMAGSFSRQLSNSAEHAASTAADGTAVAAQPRYNTSGGGLLYGAQANGEVWLNREFFFNLDLGYAAFGMGQNKTNLASNVETTSGSTSGSLFMINVNAGYTYLVTGDFFGPRAWAKVGYKINSFSLPTNLSEATAAYSAKALYLGIGGDLPIRGKYGARIDLKFGVFNSGAETDDPNGKATASHLASIYLGGYFRYKPRIHFQAGFEIEGTGSDFDSGTTLSQRTFNFTPSVKYLF